MGMFLNPGNAGFESAIHSEIFVDKTERIGFTNKVLGTNQRFMCVSRPRRFGKSMAAKMLAAYYSRGCDSHLLFENTRAASLESYERNMNQYNILLPDIQWFRSVAKDKGQEENVVAYMQKEIVEELRIQYEDAISRGNIPLPESVFVVIIDEWDCLFCEDKDNKRVQEIYINFLHGLFKGIQTEEFIVLAYLTGILPIKKYGTQSALNNFDEYTMISPKMLAKYVGFTEDDVSELCQKYNMNFSEIKHWYDGYSFNRINRYTALTLL